MKTGVSSANCFNRDGADGILEYVFTSWPKFLRVRATVKLNGKPTAVLSIGQRGTLLLKVFLATATAKQIFIIDQPEDNLDNSFIMQELVPLLRQAKKNRQIIMSTHNANLVVNADAEQIIVAQLDGSGNYISGSIENPTINRAIRDILEGGEDAFRKRERKYQVL
jgi:ABC-type cobalamin/Fe3+-siderophores transport system ATPase subunit